MKFGSGNRMPKSTLIHKPELKHQNANSENTNISSQDNLCYWEVSLVFNVGYNKFCVQASNGRTGQIDDSLPYALNLRGFSFINTLLPHYNTVIHSINGLAPTAYTSCVQDLHHNTILL